MAPKRKLPKLQEEQPDSEKDARPSASARAGSSGGNGAEADIEQGPNQRREVMANVARRRAAHFAHFQDEDEVQEGNVHVGSNEACALGPWSSAVQLVNAREKALEERLEKGAKGEMIEDPGIQWTASRDASLGPRKPSSIPSLFEISLDLLAQHVDCIDSLEGVPESLKNVLAARVCRLNSLSPDVAHLFLDGAPSEIILPNCTAFDSQAMSSLLVRVTTPALSRLKLGFCGRGFGDAAALEIGRRGPLPVLHEICLGGTYRLSDKGLLQVVGAAPNLTSLAVTSAPRLSAASILRLPEIVPCLKSLNLTDCRGVEASVIAAAAQQFPGLECLTLDGIADVDDATLVTLSRCSSLHSLSLSHCAGVTDEGLSALAAGRPGLQTLVLDECGHVGERGLRAVAAACSGLKVLSLRRLHRITDASVAAIAVRGSLVELHAAGVGALGVETMSALASTCHNTLEVLDVSFCRNIPDKAFGLVADRCRRLRKVLVYGCSQITLTSVYGHSNDLLTSFTGLGTCTMANDSSNACVSCH